MRSRSVARLLTLTAVLGLFVASTSCRSNRTAAVATQRPHASSAPYFEIMELVSANADGDNTNGGAGWGPMANRIVRMSNGDLYTTYNSPNGDDVTTRIWYLARRDAVTGTWQTVANGGPVRESAQVLRGPKDSLHVVAAPGGLPADSYSTDGVHFAAAAIPGSWETSAYDYLATAISPDGDTYVFTSNGSEQPGLQQSSYYSVHDGQWYPFTNQIDYRYTYIFAFPQNSGKLAFVATRDVQWQTLGYSQPPSSGDSYVFNAFKYFYTANITSAPVKGLLLKEEPPASPGQYVIASISDAYMDDQGRLHIIYSFGGPDTVDEWGAEFTGRHMIVQDGKVIKDVALPGNFPDPFLARITQDTQGNYYIFSIYGGNAYMLQEDNVDGTSEVPVTVIPMPNYACNGDGAGSFIATPRSGTPIADYVDGVCDAGSGSKQWVYFRLRLLPSTSESVSRLPAVPGSVFGNRVRSAIDGALHRCKELVRNL